MGQVPVSTASAVKILVIGDGRLATTLLGVLQNTATSTTDPSISFDRWSRRASADGGALPLAEKIKTFDPTHVWLAISDRSLPTFVDQHQSLFDGRTVVHFAGSLGRIGNVYTAHPLSTFASPVSPAEFSKVPFVLDLESPELEQLLPGFANPSYRLKPDARAYYHALCAIAGNFTTLLWETVQSRFESELALDPKILASFRHQTFKNLEEANGQSVLTGPLSRGDTTTLDTHKRALNLNYEMPLLKIYEAFSDLHRTEST